MTFDFKEFNKTNLISILGVMEKYGWNIFIRNNSECFILKENPKDFSELLTKNYVCLKIISESVIKLGVHLENQKVKFIDDFCQKKILITDNDIRILANEREISFKNFSENTYEQVKDFRYKRRDI